MSYLDVEVGVGTIPLDDREEEVLAGPGESRDLEGEGFCIFVCNLVVVFLPLSFRLCNCIFVFLSDQEKVETLKENSLSKV